MEESEAVRAKAGQSRLCDYRVQPDAAAKRGVSLFGHVGEERVEVRQGLEAQPFLH